MESEHSDHYYLVLYQMRLDGEHHPEDPPLAAVTGLILPAADDEVRARCKDAAHTLAEWLIDNRQRFLDSTGDYPVLHP